MLRQWCLGSDLQNTAVKPKPRYMELYEHKNLNASGDTIKTGKGPQKGTEHLQIAYLLRDVSPGPIQNPYGGEINRPPLKRPDGF